MGRALAPADDERSGGNAVVVLSDKGWARRFNRDPNVLGRTVVVNGAAVRDHRRHAGGIPRPRSERARPLGAIVAAGAVPAGRPRPRRQRRTGCRRPAEAGCVDGERARPAFCVGVEPTDLRSGATPADHRPRPQTRHASAADGSDRGLCTVVLRVRLDPADRVRQRREPVARARRGASARDRHSAVAGRVATPHCPAVDDRELAARAGGGRRRLPGVAPHARRIRLLGDARHAGRSRRRQYQRARRGLARRNVSGASPQLPPLRFSR